MDWLRPVGEKILEAASLQEEDVVLDVATGSGEPGLSAAKRLRKGKVIGIDLSEEMVGIAKEKAGRLGIKNYETRIYDSAVLPFGANYFDAVLSRFGVMFFPDILTGLKEMVRVLKPDKRLVVSVWGPQDERAKHAQEILTKALQLPQPTPDTPGPFRCSEQGSITSLMNKSGLHGVKEIELTGERTWDSPEQYWEFATEINPAIATAYGKVSEQVRNKVKGEVVGALESAKGKRGEISFNWVAWINYGTK